MDQFLLIFIQTIRKRATTVFIAILLFPVLPSFAASCPDDNDTNTISDTSCTVTGNTAAFLLKFNSGFTDSTALSAVGGNPGTTVGQQRKRAFIKAASIIADVLSYTVVGSEIVIDADFFALSCDANSGVLGSAGATKSAALGTTNGNWLVNTFYPISLWSQLNNSDQKNNLNVTSDIEAEFNSDIGDSDCLSNSDGWYYGYDAPPTGDNAIGFVTVLLHELTHGLGFASLVDPSTGEKANGIDDIYSNFLFDADNGAWPDLDEDQRKASAISSTKLLWDGSHTNTAAINVVTAGFQDNDSSGDFNNGDRIQMYAPASVKGGSSVSHFNTHVTPNELMEPEYTEGQNTLGLALHLLHDLGWSIQQNNNLPTLSISNQSTIKNTPKMLALNDFSNDGDNDNLTYSIDACATRITCSLSGSSLTLTPDNDHTGDTHTISIRVDDVNGGTAMSSFNLSVVENLTATINGQVLDANSDTLISPSETVIALGNGSEQFTVSLTYESSNASTLLSHDTVTNSVTIGVPSSGSFAGEYSLTVLDTATQETVEYRLKRPPNLVWSATAFLNGNTQQTLSIEGGAAGTQFTVLQSPSNLLSFVNSNDHTQSFTTLIATDNSALFNPAVASVLSETVTVVEQTDITVQSIYDDATTNNISVYPSTLHRVNVENTSGSPISQASLTFASNALLTALRIDSTYHAASMGAATGEIQVLLPDDTTSYSATISATGFQSQTINLRSGDSPYTVRLLVDTSGEAGSSGGSIGKKSSGGSIFWCLLLSLWALTLNRQRLAFLPKSRGVRSRRCQQGM